MKNIDSNGRQLKIGVILSYATTAVNMVIQLIYTPVMIRLLGQSEYGLYTLVGSVVSYLSLFSLGFTGAYLRFYSRYKKDNDYHKISRLNGMFLTLFLIMAIVALVCGMSLSQFTPQLFGDKLNAAELEKAKILMQILVINIALTFPSSVFESIEIAHEKYLFQRVLALVGIVVNPFICLPLLLMGYGSVALVVISTSITVIKLVVNIWYCLRKMGETFVFGEIDFGLLREIAGFSFFIFLNMIIDQINWSVDKFVLGRVSGTTAVAVYSVGAQFNAIYMQFSTSISSVFSPGVNRIVMEDNADKCARLTKLFIKVGRIQFIVLLLVLSGYIFLGKYFIINIYLTNEYADSYWVGLLLMGPSIIPLIQNLGIEIQRAMNAHRFRSIVYTIMALLNLVISIPLAMWFGPIGSAMGTMIGLLLANGLIMNIYYHKVLGINMLEFWKSIQQLSKGLVVPGVLGIIIITQMKFDNIVMFGITILGYVAVYAGSFWKLGMNSEEKQLVINMCKSVLKRH